MPSRMRGCWLLAPGRGGAQCPVERGAAGCWLLEEGIALSTLHFALCSHVGCRDVRSHVRGRACGTSLRSRGVPPLQEARGKRQEARSTWYQRECPVLSAQCPVERGAAGCWLLEEGIALSTLHFVATQAVGTCVRTSADVPVARPYAQGAFPLDLSTFPPFRPFCSTLTAHSSKLAAGGWRLAAGGWRLAAGGWRLAAGSPLSSHLSQPAAGGAERVLEPCRGFGSGVSFRKW